MGCTTPTLYCRFLLFLAMSSPSDLGGPQQHPALPSEVGSPESRIQNPAWPRRTPELAQGPSQPSRVGLGGSLISYLLVLYLGLSQRLLALEPPRYWLPSPSLPCKLCLSPPPSMLRPESSHITPSSAPLIGAKTQISLKAMDFPPNLQRVYSEAS